MRGTSTSSPTIDAFSRSSSLYASLTGVQLTRLSPVNKRAPSHGEAFAKGESSTEKIPRASWYEDPNFRRIREASPNPPPASFTSLFPATFSRNV